jgi:predicted Zn-dependent protease
MPIRFHRTILGLCYAALCGLLVACASGGRQWEQEAGREAAAEVARAMGVVEGGLADYVAAVGDQLVSRSQATGGPYRFHVVDMVEPNAFALPGGYVYVSRGLLALLNDEDELASVMAHEIGHVVARHHIKSTVRSVPLLPVSIATAIGATAVGIVSRGLGDLVAAIGQAPGALVLASYSRRQENEADEIGQGIAAASGWDPAALSRVMRTLGREEALRGGDPNRQSFFATHPTSPDREQVTARRAARLERAPRAGLVSDADAFLSRLEGMLVGPSGAEGVFVDSRFLHPDLDFGLSFPDDWKTRNSAEAVMGAAPDGNAVVLLTLSPDQTDALEAARAKLDQLRATIERGPELTTLGELRAASAQIRRDDARILAHWVEHGDHVFQIAGIAGAAAFEERRGVLLRVARSFRPLRREERSQIKESRLRLVRAEPGDTIERVVERSSTTWSPEEVAVSNGLRADEPLPAGRRLKLPVPELYRGR